MDIWEKLYQKAKEQYHPQEVSPFIYAHHVVCAYRKLCRCDGFMC